MPTVPFSSAYFPALLLGVRTRSILRSRAAAQGQRAQRRATEVNITPGGPSLGYEEAHATYQIVSGNPDTVIKKLQHSIDLVDPGYLILWGREGPMSHEVARRAIDLLGQEVPHPQGLPARPGEESRHGWAGSTLASSDLALPSLRKRLPGSAIGQVGRPIRAAKTVEGTAPFDRATRRDALGEILGIDYDRTGSPVTGAPDGPRPQRQYARTARPHLLEPYRR